MKNKTIRKKRLTGHFNTLMGHIRRKSGPSTPVLGRFSFEGKNDEAKEAEKIRDGFGVNFSFFFKWKFMNLSFFFLLLLLN